MNLETDMILNPLRKKLLNRETTFGLWVTLESPNVHGRHTLDGETPMELIDTVFLEITGVVKRVIRRAVDHREQGGSIANPPEGPDHAGFFRLDSPPGGVET